MQTSIQEAFLEACTALGESLVRERLMGKLIAEAQAKAQEAPKPEAAASDTGATP